MKFIWVCRILALIFVTLVDGATVILHGKFDGKIFWIVLITSFILGFAYARLERIIRK